MSDLQSARAGAVETQFAIVGMACKIALFYLQFRAHVQYLWHENPFEIHSKSSSEARSAKVCFFMSGTVWGTSWAICSCLCNVMAFKNLRFPWAGGPGPTKNDSSPGLGPLALQKNRVFSNHAPSAVQKPTLWHDCPWLWAPGHPKEGQLKFDLKLGSAT